MMYQNPILYADYSDPDVIRVGDAYYLIASSFCHVPGVPVLRSYNLVDWEQIGYCVERLPFAHYDQPMHGWGTWAPALRWHAGRFYAFIPLPDEGIYYAAAENPEGPWTPLQCVIEAKGWIDPCPFWDDDGRVYMIHAFAKSRSGIKHRLSIIELDPQTLAATGEDTTVFENAVTQPTLEGPKLYKRNGWYYIFAPAGGVPTGWQTVFRSRSIYGPYEEKIVLHQGNTRVNGPHQGGWVQSPDGQDWFVHFQDAGVFGRIVHLQPMRWLENDWPIIGEDRDGDGIGEPVSAWESPAGRACGPIPRSDAFSGPALGVQWQWQANPQPHWYTLPEGENSLRLFVQKNEKRDENLLWYAPNTLTQMITGPSYAASVTVRLCKTEPGDHAGIGLLGHAYSCLSIASCAEGYALRLARGEVTEPTGEGVAHETVVATLPVEGPACRLSLSLLAGDRVQYAYKLEDSAAWIPIGDALPASKGTWTGARLALYALNEKNEASEGYADFNDLMID